jgi:flagellar biosynthesis protein FlhF
VALCGPSGGGKTTTLAKIATRAALVHRRRVAIVGCDGDRLGAMRALADTAELIGVPFVAAPDARGLVGALARIGPQDLVLIDTSGHSPRETAAISALRGTLEEAGAEPLLVLNADMRVLEIDASIASFGALSPRALVLTKIDQAVALGALYDAAVSSGLPVMYLGCGRRIPEDLEPAEPQRIVSLVLGFQFN